MTTDTTSRTGYIPARAVAAAREAELPETLEALARVLRRLQATGGPLAPILSVATNGREVQIQPWIACAPVTAVHSYEQFFTGTVDRRATPLLDADGKPTGVTTITSSGTIDGLPVTLSAATYREVRTSDQDRVSAETFAELAAQENPLASPDIADLLGIWDDPERFSAAVGLAEDGPDEEPDTTDSDDPDDTEPAAAETTD